MFSLVFLTTHFFLPIVVLISFFATKIEKCSKIYIFVQKYLTILPKYGKLVLQAQKGNLWAKKFKNTKKKFQKIISY